MKHGVLFEINGIKKHSLDDFGLLLVSFEHKPPEVKTSYVEIEGSDGSVDLTEAFGRVYYKQRNFNIKFEFPKKEMYEDTLNKLTAYLHGKVGKVTEWCDDKYYYSNARLKINSYTSSKAKGTIEINVIADTYKMHQEETIHNLKIEGSRLVHIANDSKPSVPTFIATAETVVKYKNSSYVIGRTEKLIPDIVLEAGDNILEFIGDSVVTIKYQEGAL